MAQSCNGAKSDGGIAYRFLITFGINALGIKSLIKYANNLRRSTHRQCLRDYHCFVWIILRTLLFSVWHFIKVINLAGTLFTPNICTPKNYNLVSFLVTVIFNISYNSFIFRILMIIKGWQKWQQNRKRYVIVFCSWMEKDHW